MGSVPDTKAAPEGRRRCVAEQEQPTEESLVSFVLDVLAGILHVFTKPMRCVTAGENNLAHNRNQNTEDHSFQFFHFFTFPSLLRPRRALQSSQEGQDDDDYQEKPHHSARSIPPAIAISPGWQYSDQRKYQ
jgi:hypothetical protein